MLLSDTTLAYPLDLKAFPKTSGVYIVYAWSRPIYVGRTAEFAQRLRYHNHEQWLKHSATHLRLIECTTEEIVASNGFIATLERKLIKELKPLLNGGTRGKRG